jgi:hypothetical protein
VAEDLVINANEFISEIEVLHKSLGLTYMEAIVYWCEARALDVESVSHIVKKNRVMKSRLKTEAEDLNYIKRKKSAKLPL